MGGEGEDLEPLFDYHRVQPANFVCIDDDDSDVSEVPVKKRAKISQKPVLKEDEDVKVIEVAGDDDWLPPPPKVIFDKNKEPGEDSTIKALRSKKMELMSFAKNVADVMQEVEESAKREVEESLNPSSEAADVAAAQAPEEPKNDRAKIVITIQDKNGKKQFRVYADEKFERVFKMYTDKEKLDPQNIVFIFDGDKINPSMTPSNLGMEDDDMIELLADECTHLQVASVYQIWNFSPFNYCEIQSLYINLGMEGISAKTADAANLCLNCDAKVHSANALSGRHLRTLLCDSCKNQPCVVRCLDHKMFLCNGCNDKLHGCVSPKHNRRDVSCYTSCPSAKDFAVMWGFRVTDDDVSLEQSFSMVKLKGQSVMNKVQREAGFIILEQILELEKIQLREVNDALSLTEQADDPSPLELPKQSEDRLIDLPQTGKDLIVDFSHLSSSSTLGDSFWECKSPYNKNSQLWHQNIQDIGVCEDTVCDDDDFHIPDIDLTFRNFEEIFGADTDPIVDNNNVFFAGTSARKSFEMKTFSSPFNNSIFSPKQASSSLSFSRSNGGGGSEAHYPHNHSEEVISFCSPLSNNARQKAISRLKEKKRARTEEKKA
ncbi:unnamed protein product [Arabis nemorensis]|uniref:Ubiquitin-like domain-containing protein n=1 Tax=Arabis nemorensis TaxID=586526 RepID=A0A565AYH9_9BRAS|nr:unnamed protein product [Arabis nemorensis]